MIPPSRITQSRKSLSLGSSFFSSIQLDATELLSMSTRSYSTNHSCPLSEISGENLELGAVTVTLKKKKKKKKKKSEANGDLEQEPSDERGAVTNNTPKKKKKKTKKKKKKSPVTEEYGDLEESLDEPGVSPVMPTLTRHETFERVTNSYAKDLIYCADDSDLDDSISSEDEGDFLGSSQDQMDRSPVPLQGENEGRIEMLEDSVAVLESKVAEQEEQIAMYKGMFEDVEEDYNMATAKFKQQVEQNAAMLGLVAKMKKRVCQCEKELEEKLNQIHKMEEQLSTLQQTEQFHLVLTKLQAENAKLKELADLQKQSLFRVFTGKGAGY